MRVLHTSDWHLGRVFYNVSLIEDQAWVLDRLVQLAIDERVDAVLIAGDVYDRAVPPTDAVALLDEVLSRLVLGARIPVVLIAGNHDSADRLGFASRIAESAGLMIRGTLGSLAPISLSDAHGVVAVHPVPYVEPAYARAMFQHAQPADVPGSESGVFDHQAAMNRVMSRVRAQRVSGQRNILVGHAFVAGGAASDSERPLSVGGSGLISTATFEGFDYVALGHLHRPQAVGAEHIQYAGSLLKYSFNEVDQPKSVSIVDLAGNASVQVKRVPLGARRDVRVVRGTLAELIAAPALEASRDDYLMAELTDTAPVLDPLARLRAVYPNMMTLQMVSIGQSGDAKMGAHIDHRARQPEELFKAFYRDVMGEALGAAEQEVFNDALSALRSPEAGAGE
jgi:exonuclease SbcD